MAKRTQLRSEDVLRVVDVLEEVAVPLLMSRGHLRNSAEEYVEMMKGKVEELLDYTQ